MSGGTWDHSHGHIYNLADDIEAMFIKDGKYMTEDWSISQEELNKRFDHYERPMIEADRIGDATLAERKLILKEIKQLIKDLKSCAFRVKTLDWLLAGDYGIDTYLEEIKKKI